MTHVMAPLREDTGEVAASSLPRSCVYAILSRSLSFPEVRFHSDIRRGFWMESLAVWSGRLPYPLRLPSPARFSVPADFDVFQSEYIRLFEMGGGRGAPCPLYSGHYSIDRVRTLESVLRFYHFFGLRPDAGVLPDHVSIELEFMQYLAEQEGEAESQRDRASLRRAQLDFLETHLLSWWPRLTATLREQRPIPFYRAVADLMLRFLQADKRYLSTA